MRGGFITPDELRKHGAIVGNNCFIYTKKIDLGHAFLLKIGNNVTISDARILEHDASTVSALHKARVGHVEIGDNCFIGADAIILPNVTIGNNVIVGAGSVVTKNIEDNTVVVGNPAHAICSYEEYIERNCLLMEERKKEGKVYNTYWANKTKAEIQKMQEDLMSGGIGFDI